MVRIFYYDARLVQQHLFETEQTFDELDVRCKLQRILCLIGKPELRFTCGTTLQSSDLDKEEKKVFLLTFDVIDEDLINHISIVLDIVLGYSA